MLGLVLVVATMAEFDRGVSVRFQNTTNYSVVVYSWDARKHAEPAGWTIKLYPSEIATTGWIQVNPRDLYRRVEARDASGTVLFCQIYTWKDRINDQLWEVVIVQGQNSCP